MGKTKYALKILESAAVRPPNSTLTDQTIQNKMVGRRPCARDGHSAVISDSSCFIFGGDRHMMSYNDMYVVDLDKIIDWSDNQTNQLSIFPQFMFLSYSFNPSELVK